MSMESAQASASRSARTRAFPDAAALVAMHPALAPRELPAVGPGRRRDALSSLGRAVAAVLMLAPLGACNEGRLFDGATLAGWHVSAASNNSVRSGHLSGGDWRVVDGTIVGRQDPPGNGGLLVTDRDFGDVEIVLETADDWGTDSGLFLRTTETGAAYQVMIDLYPTGTVGGIWGEQLPQTLDVRRFVFGDSPDGTLWRPGWNELRARIIGNPPRITTWLNGVLQIDFQDTERRLPDRGAIALQMHGGDAHGRGAVRFRAIRVTPLD